MKIRTSQLKPNRFRDFELYPIDDEQVQRLSQSMDSLGFFSGVTARSTGNGSYELAAGHHRVAAADKLDIREVEAVVEDYTDAQMVEIMMVENMTQRGHNAASILDSVAAYSKLISRDVLLGEGPVSKILDTVDRLPQVQGTIAKEGPGMRLLYRAMNGFDKEERRVNKDAEVITQAEIEHALANLKSSGLMAKIVADAFEEAEDIRGERQAEVQPHDLTREEKVEEEKVEKRRTKQRKAVKDQSAKKVIYDHRCAHIFRLSNHEKTFRDFVTSENGQRFIAMDKQYELAKSIRAEIDAIEKEKSVDLGSVGISTLLNGHLAKLIGLKRDMDAKEKQELERQNAQKRVENLWVKLRRGATQAHAALTQLVEEEKEWKYEKALFPMYHEDIDKVISIGQRMEKMKKALGY